MCVYMSGLCLLSIFFVCSDFANILKIATYIYIYIYIYIMHILQSNQAFPSKILTFYFNVKFMVEF